MAKVVTLKQNTLFRRLYGRGKSYAAPALVTYILPSGAGCCRIGITTSKKIGNAVTRNRARRVIKAAWMQVMPSVSKNVDIVFVARGKTPYRKSGEIAEVMREHLTSFGAIRDEENVKTDTATVD